MEKKSTFNNDSSDERKIVDVDPLNKMDTKLLGSTYKTTMHSIKLCTPELPISDKEEFIFFGNSELTKSNGFFLPSFEVYVKKEWFIGWCENLIRKQGGWYVLREIAKLLLDDLNKGNRYIHFFELVKQYYLEELKKELIRYSTPHEFTYDGKKYTIDANEIKNDRYTRDGYLREYELIKSSIRVKKAIFCELLQDGKVVIIDRNEDGKLFAAKEVEYYGSGDQVGPECGGGGIHFVYKGVHIAYVQTWAS